jgi:hypothetical protein
MLEGAEDPEMMSWWDDVLTLLMDALSQINLILNKTQQEM